MPIDFPNSPTTNDTYTVGDRTWVYDGEKWVFEYAEEYIPINLVTRNATYTLAITDAGRFIQMNVGSANILYVPTDASVNFAVGTTIDVLQIGSGKTQIAAVSSGTTTINSASGLFLRAQWSSATLIKRAANTWVVVGDLATS